MVQLLLSLTSLDITQINHKVSILKKEGRWIYFLGVHSIYHHLANDKTMFRLTIAQLIESGACRQIEVINALDISKRSVIRAQNKLRKGGLEAFFSNNRGRSKGGRVLRPKVLEKAQSLLDQGFARREIAEELKIKCNGSPNKKWPCQMERQLPWSWLKCTCIQKLKIML